MKHAPQPPSSPISPPAPAAMDAPASSPSPAVFAALKVFGWVVLALMLGSIGYAAWIAAANWGAIGV